VLLEGAGVDGVCGVLVGTWAKPTVAIIIAAGRNRIFANRFIVYGFFMLKNG
jgi:hypothetical protein